MKEFVEKLIGRLEEYKDSHLIEHNSEQCKHCIEKGYKECEGLDCVLCVWDKAIGIINELAESYHIHCEQEYMRGYEDARKNDGWIPCSSGNFPTDEVLVCREDGIIDFDVFDFMHEDWKFNSNHHKNKVIAWQPLPQAYYEEGVENVRRKRSD